MLRDCLACGCCLQCKLLAEADPTFERTFKQAKAMEIAERDSIGLQDNTRDMMPPTVNGVITQSSGRHGRRLQSCPPWQASQTVTTLELNINPLSVSFDKQNVTFAKKGAYSKVCLSKN